MRLQGAVSPLSGNGPRTVLREPGSNLRFHDLHHGPAAGAQEKLAVMEACGIKVTKNPAEMGRLLKSVLKG